MTSTRKYLILSGELKGQTHDGYIIFGRLTPDGKFEQGVDMGLWIPALGVRVDFGTHEAPAYQDLVEARDGRSAPIVVGDIVYAPFGKNVVKVVVLAIGDIYRRKTYAGTRKLQVQNLYDGRKFVINDPSTCIKA